MGGDDSRDQRSPESRSCCEKSMRSTVSLCFCMAKIIDTAGKPVKMGETREIDVHSTVAPRESKSKQEYTAKASWCFPVNQQPATINIPCYSRRLTCCNQTMKNSTNGECWPNCSPQLLRDGARRERCSTKKRLPLVQLRRPSQMFERQKRVRAKQTSWARLRSTYYSRTLLLGFAQTRFGTLGLTAGKYV